MKVSEAETKVCPFAFGIEAHYVDMSKSATTINIKTGMNCICGECMAWKYTKTHKSKVLLHGFDTILGREEKKTMEKDGYKKTEDGISEWWIKELPQDKKEGFCKRLEFER